mgnify:CR=1 FL=1
MLAVAALARGSGARVPLRTARALAPSRAALGVVSAVALLAVVGVVWTMLRPTPPRTLGHLALSAALVIGCLGALVVPAFHAAQPLEAVVADVQRELRYRPDAVVAACTDPARMQRDLLFHARAVMEERCDLWALASSSRPYLLLLDPEQRRSLLAAEGVREVARYPYLARDRAHPGGRAGSAGPLEMTLAANFPTDDPVAESKRKRDRKRALREPVPPQ